MTDKRHSSLDQAILGTVRPQNTPTVPETNGTQTHRVSAETQGAIEQTINNANFTTLLQKKITECTDPAELERLRTLHANVLRVAKEWRNADKVTEPEQYQQLAALHEEAKACGLDGTAFLFVRKVHALRKHTHPDDDMPQLEALAPLFAEQKQRMQEQPKKKSEKTPEQQQHTREHMTLLQTQVDGLLGELMQLLLEERRQAWKKATPRWKFWARFPEKQEQEAIWRTLRSWPADHRRGKSITPALLTEEVHELTTQKHAILGLPPPVLKTPLNEQEIFAEFTLPTEPHELDALNAFIDEDTSLEDSFKKKKKETKAPIAHPHAFSQEPLEHTAVEEAPSEPETPVAFGGTATIAHETEGTRTWETPIPSLETAQAFSLSTADIQSAPEVTKDEPRTSPQETAELPVTPNAQVLALPYSEDLMQTDTLHALLQEGRDIEVTMCVEEGQPPVTIHIQEMRTQNNFVIWSTPGQDGLRAASLTALRRLNEPKVEKHYPLAVSTAKAPRTIDEQILHVSNTIASAVRTPVQLPRKQAQPLLLTHEPVAQEAAPTPVLEPVEKKAVPAKPTIDLTTQKLPSDTGVLTRSNIFTASDALLTFEQLHLLAKRQGQYIDGSIFGKKARMMVLGMDPAGNIEMWCTFEDLSTPGKRTVHINNLRQSNDLLPIQMCSGSPEVAHNTERRTHLPFRGSIFVQTLMDELGRGYGPEAEHSFAGAQAGELSQLVRDAMRTSSSLEALEPVLLEIIEKYDEEVSEGFARAWRAATSLANNHKAKPVITPVQGTPARQTTSWAKRLTAGIKSLFVG